MNQRSYDIFGHGKVFAAAPNFGDDKRPEWSEEAREDAKILGGNKGIGGILNSSVEPCGVSILLPSDEDAAGDEGDHLQQFRLKLEPSPLWLCQWLQLSPYGLGEF